MGSAGPAAAVISLIDKRIRDLMMVRDKQIMTPGSTGSTAVIDMMSEVVDGPATAAPRRTRGRMKKVLPTPPLFRELVESGPSAAEYDSGGYITVRRRSRRRRAGNDEPEIEGTYVEVDILRGKGRGRNLEGSRRRRLQSR